jgi:microcystin-dependent protein
VNLQEVALIGKGTMGGAADPGLVTNAGITTLGTILGEGKHTIAQNELPNVVPVFSGGTTAKAYIENTTGQQAVRNDVPNVTVLSVTAGIVASQITSSGIISSINGNVTEQAHNNVQPSIVCNWITLLG